MSDNIKAISLLDLFPSVNLTPTKTESYTFQQWQMHKKTLAQTEQDTEQAV